MFCIFLQSLAYLVLFIDIFRKSLQITLTSIFVTGVQSIYVMQSVCGMIYLYIKLLIVKMSGEYLYFSLSASFNIKNLF